MGFFNELLETAESSMNEVFDPGARAYDAVDRYEKGGREMVAGQSRFAAGGESFD